MSGGVSCGALQLVLAQLLHFWLWPNLKRFADAYRMQMEHSRPASAAFSRSAHSCQSCSGSCRMTLSRTAASSAQMRRPWQHRCTATCMH